MQDSLFYATTRVSDIADELQLTYLDANQIESNLSLLELELCEPNKLPIVKQALEKEKNQLQLDLAILNTKISKLTEEMDSLAHMSTGESILTSLKEINVQINKVLEPNANRSKEVIRDLISNISEEVELIKYNLKVLDSKVASSNNNADSCSDSNPDKSPDSTKSTSNTMSFEEFIGSLPLDLSIYSASNRKYSLEGFFDKYKKDLSYFINSGDFDFGALFDSLNSRGINNGNGISSVQIRQAMSRAGISLSPSSKNTALCIEFKNNKIFEASNKETIAKFFNEIGIVDVYSKCYPLFGQTFTLNPLKSISQDVPYYSQGIECGDFYLIAYRRTKDLISKLNEICDILGVGDVRVYAVNS